MEESNPVTREAGRIIAERSWAEFKADLTGSFCLTLNQAAGHIGLSPENTRRLAERHGVLIDCGPRAKRISIAGMEIILAGQTRAKTKPAERDAAQPELL